MMSLCYKLKTNHDTESVLIKIAIHAAWFNPMLEVVVDN
jgi:hypothetical protein